MQKYDSVDEYINSFQDPKKSKLEELRKKMKEWVPEAEEVISYRMPAYKVTTGSGIARFENDLKKYENFKRDLETTIR